MRSNSELEKTKRATRVARAARVTRVARAARIARVAARAGVARVASLLASLPLRVTAACCRAGTLVERFDIEPFRDFSAK